MEKEQVLLRRPSKDRARFSLDHHPPTTNHQPASSHRMVAIGLLVISPEIQPQLVEFAESNLAMKAFRLTVSVSVVSPNLYFSEHCL